MRRGYLLWVGLLLLAGCARSPEPYRAVLQAHLARYPAMTVQDVYKLCHQAAMGSAHLGADTAMVYRYLLDELDGVAASADEPLVEGLSPDGAVVRVNLRPFKQRGGDPAALFRALMRSWEALGPSEEALRRCWQDAEAMAADGAASFDPAVLDTFLHEMAAQQYPAVHHSDVYTEHYHPAYRVVLRQFLDEAGLPLEEQPEGSRR